MFLKKNVKVKASKIAKFLGIKFKFKDFHRRHSKKKFRFVNPILIQEFIFVMCKIYNIFAWLSTCWFI